MREQKKGGEVQQNRLPHMVNILKGIVLIMLLAFIIPITIKSFYILNKGARYINTCGNIKIIIIGLGVIILSLFVFSYFKKIMRLEERRLRYHMIGLSLLILTLQMLIFKLFEVTPITDNYIVLDLASAMSKGKISKLAYPGLDYFSRYGNMYFYAIVLKYIFKAGRLFGITNCIKLAVVVNIVLIDAGVYFGYKIVVRLFDKKRAVAFLALVALNPLFYLMLPWTYTATYSMPFFMGVMYYGIVCYQEEKLWVKVASVGAIAICSIIGYFLRPTVLIATIALACTGILLSLSKKGYYKQFLLACLVFLMVAGSGYYTISKVISSYHPDFNGNYPITHWLMMGMHGEGRVNPFDDEYTAQFPTKEEKKQANLKKIKEYWKEEGLSGYVATLQKKLEIVWMDGTAGYVGRMQQDKNQSALYEYLAGGRRDGILLYCQIYQAFLYVFITYSVICSLRKERRNGIFMLQLVLLGAILFYLIWEAKELYRVPFLGLLALLAVVGIDDKYARPSRMRKPTRNVFLGGILVIIASTVFLLIYGVRYFTEEPYKATKYSVISLGEDSTMDYMDDIASRKRKIEQEFYAIHDFNRIVLNGREIEQGNQKYVIEILDENKKQCKRFVINYKKIKMDYKITLNMDTMPGGKKYYIRIRAKKPLEKDTIAFAYRKSITTSQYNGKFIDLKENKTYASDLYLQVMEKTETTYASKLGYCIVGIVLILLEILVCLWYYQTSKDSEDQQFEA